MFAPDARHIHEKGYHITAKSLELVSLLNLFEMVQTPVSYELVEYLFRVHRAGQF